MYFNCDNVIDAKKMFFYLKVMNVCTNHGLYDAIIYVYNNGLQDFVAPVEELMTILAEALKSQDQVLICVKLTFYHVHKFQGSFKYNSFLKVEGDRPYNFCWRALFGFLYFSYFRTIQNLGRNRPHFLLVNWMRRDSNPQPF